MSLLPWEALLCLSPSRQASGGAMLRTAPVCKRKKMAGQEGNRMLHSACPLSPPGDVGRLVFPLSESYCQEDRWSEKVYGEPKATKQSPCSLTLTPRYGSFGEMVVDASNITPSLPSSCTRTQDPELLTQRWSWHAHLARCLSNFIKNWS